ncbi:MAG TPA: bifunctional UDP-N-acetylmuramoyl-tripeptide:D-alanyl-D-alanine ligase/alanine racemase, partial [Saprospiraceae bacterium]|nr:bifunctional UDP-N-acetylmuramoyl-tripeptide:D-alanyl-D-alanine ligase/alanine racemase [Saprospiraceae bacterium]
MKSTIREIASFIGAPYHAEWKDELKDWIIETDSRQVIDPARTIFVAFDGYHRQGIQFIPQLIQAGVRVFIADHDFNFTPGIIFLKVKSSLKAIQSLASAHRNSFLLPVIGITGSNGKTIVKEWLAQLLSTELDICKSPKSFNSQIGVALSVLQLKDNHQAGVFEAGISKFGEMDHLAQMICPGIGILTNIGDAHDEGFINRQQKLKEKIKLFRTASHFYYCGDQNLPDTPLLNSNRTAVAWGASPELPIQVNVSKENQSCNITITRNGASDVFKVPFSEKTMIENIIPCILVCQDLGIDPQKLKAELLHISGMKMRMEVKEGTGGCVLLNDSYSLDLASLRLSMQYGYNHYHNLDKILITSDFPESKKGIDPYHELAELIRLYGYSTVIGVGNQIHILRELVLPNVSYIGYRTTEELRSDLDVLHFRNKMVLLKGARAFELEKIFNHLALSQHECTLEINLKAIAHNIAVYKSMLSSNTDMIGVVKAAAYGSGNYEIAHYLEKIGFRYLAVAYQEEAVQLRKKGIQSAIMVMNSGMSDFALLAENHIEPVIFSMSQLSRLLDTTYNAQPIPIHIKLDTGMRRLGFLPEEIDELCSCLASNPRLKVVSVFSHLSGSDSPQFDDFTMMQVTRYEKMYARIIATLGYRPLRHILNSGGISRHPNLHFDMVRIGIGMYGIENYPSTSRLLEKTHILKTRITQIKKVTSIDRISYNNTGGLSGDGIIAVLSIGYADGLPRIAGIQGYKIFVNGIACPLVGAVCMDMCMVD